MMVRETLPITSRNRILAGISVEDARRLRPYLEPITLGLRHQIEMPNSPISHVYFLDSGLGSVVAVSANGRRIEAGVFGREGMSGTAVVLGNDSSPHETYMQLPGTGHRIAVDALRAAMHESATLRPFLLRYLQAFTVQTAHTALANGLSVIEERLARWLLMCHDRSDGDELHLTHEFLSLMLGVRRSGVTVAVQILEGQGLIKATRGLIVIRDREGLEESADGTYGVPEAEYERLMGSPIDIAQSV